MPSSEYPEFFFFDLGNVLLFFDHEKAVEHVSELSAAPPDRVREVIFSSGWELRYERGEISSAEFHEHICRELGVSIPLEKMLEAVSDIFHPNLPIRNSLQLLRDRGVRLGLLSNTCEAHWNWVEEHAYPTVEGWFEFPILSFRERCMKPDIAIYQKAQQRAGVAAEQIIFVDDRLENVEGARMAGWQAHLFQHHEQLQELIASWEQV